PRFRKRWPWAATFVTRVSLPIPARGLWMVIALLTMATACAGPQGQTAANSESSARPSRTLTMAVKYEVPDLAPKLPAPSGPNTTRRIFNATPALVADTGTARPYLAEALPPLTTDTWRPFPEGR